ncbi:MAG: beta-galactosidase [Planctomycetota bacterium]
MRIGTSYYPEFCPPQDWDQDLAQMRDAGVDVARVLDFAWSVIEPREGEYDWAWVDQFVEVADRHRIDLVFCTPTATPPAWLATQYPQIMIELRDGTRRAFGARRDVDVCSPIYRDYSCEIAARMAERYGGHPRVIGWQIDNELCGSEHTYPESHTPESTWRFRRWLRERYGTLDRLNDAWYLTFWNQRFSDWGEVTTPRPDRTTHGWGIDYSRFFSDMLVEYARLQYDAMRPLIREEAWITHNSTAMFDRGLDHADMARAMDVGGWDAYYGAASAGHDYKPQFIGLATDWLRTATRKPVKIMETGARDLSGELIELFAKHGADLALIYHWRAKRGNVEQGGGVCGFDGKPRPQMMARVHDAVAAAERVTPISADPQPYAFVFSVDNYRANMRRPSWVKKSGRPDYLDAMIPTYTAALDAVGPMDVVAPGQTLAGYRAVFAPALKLMDADTAALLHDYVDAGGHLVVAGPMAHQSTTAVFHNTQGEPLKALLGVEVCFDPRADLEGVQVSWADGTSHAAQGWVEHWDEADGDVLARFSGGALDGVPAVISRQVGSGSIYFSAVTGYETVTKLIHLALEQHNPRAAMTPPGL